MCNFKIISPPPASSLQLVGVGHMALPFGILAYGSQKKRKNVLMGMNVNLIDTNLDA